jgi:hypothetical protein
MPGSVFQLLTHTFITLSFVACDLVRLLPLVSRSRRALAAENLFLRKQLALFQERKLKPHRAYDSMRLIMVIRGRMFSWRDALVNVQPDTFIRWHRKGCRKSRPVGRPQISKALRRLICVMAADNPTWGEQRIANELKPKLTIQVSPRTVGKYLHRDSPLRTPDPKQRWLTFVRNHAKVIVAGDFFVVITAAFRTLYVFVVMEVGSRQILHTTSRLIPRRNGRCSSSGKRCRATIPTASSSMIAIASSLKTSTKVWRIWGYGFCGRQYEPQRRTRSASD